MNDGQGALPRRLLLLQAGQHCLSQAKSWTSEVAEADVVQEGRLLDSECCSPQAGKECCNASNSGVEGDSPWRRLAAHAQLSSGSGDGAAKRATLAAPMQAIGGNNLVKPCLLRMLFSLGACCLYLL